MDQEGMGLEGVDQSSVAVHRFFFHLVLAASLAIWLRLSGLSFAALALAIAMAWGFFSSLAITAISLAAT